MVVGVVILRWKMINNLHCWKCGFEWQNDTLNRTFPVGPCPVECPKCKSECCPLCGCKICHKDGCCSNCSYCHCGGCN